MATETYYISGLAKFPRLTKPDEKYDNYSIGVILDDKSRAQFKESGMQLTEREYDGDKFVTFRRPNSKAIKDELVKFGAPKVMDKDGNTITALVGNGSEVTAKVIVYDSAKGKGHRLEAVRVDKLIEFVPTPREGADLPTNGKMPF
jgi:hypothetical protein